MAWKPRPVRYVADASQSVGESSRSEAPSGRLRPVRSALFVPANQREWIEKSPKYGADVVVLDLEDATPLGEKRGAQEIVSSVIAQLHEQGQGVWVRVNEIGGPYIGDDVEACCRHGVDAVCLPKVAGPADVRELDSMLTYAEGAQGLPRGSIRIVPLLETAAAIADAAEVFRSSKRVAYGGGMVAASGDVALAIGFRWTDSFEETCTLRSQVLITARACGLHNPMVGLVTAVDAGPVRRFAEQNRGLGYEGMFVIHPTHVPIVNDLFRPSDEELTWSAEVIEAAAVAESEGRGAFVDSEGRMIDKAMLGVAEEFLERDRLFASRADTPAEESVTPTAPIDR